MMKKLRVLLVGYGPRGIMWSKVIKKNQKAILVGVCDINSNIQNRFSKKFPFFSILEKAIQELNPDIILLCTPPFNRMKDFKICAKYRLPILVEKPLAVNLKEALKLVDFMNKQKLFLMVGLNFRYLPTTTKKINLIKSQKVGKPNFSKFIYERWRDGNLKRLNKYPLYMDYPMLWEQSIHHFDLIRFIYKSNVKSVFATSSNPPWSMYAHDTNVNAILELKNGMLVNYIGNWQSNCKSLNFEWRTDCTKGIIIQKKQFSDLSYRQHNSLNFKNIKLGNFKMWTDDAQLLLLDFIKSIKNNKNLLKTNKDHLNSLSIVDACIKSSKSGKKIIIKNY